MADLKMPRLNKIIISGRVTNDIEMRYTAKGTPVVRFTIANDRAVKDESGNYQNQASFFEVVAWSNWAESVNNNAHKGSPVIVEGRLEARTYVDKDNNNRKVVEIIAEYIQFLEYKARPDGDANANNVPMPNDNNQSSSITDDDVPF